MQRESAEPLRLERHDHRPERTHRDQPPCEVDRRSLECGPEFRAGQEQHRGHRKIATSDIGKRQKQRDRQQVTARGRTDHIGRTLRIDQRDPNHDRRDQELGGTLDMAWRNETQRVETRHMRSA